MAADKTGIVIVVVIVIRAGGVARRFLQGGQTEAMVLHGEVLETVMVHLSDPPAFLVVMMDRPDSPDVTLDLQTEALMGQAKMVRSPLFVLHDTTMGRQGFLDVTMDRPDSPGVTLDLQREALMGQVKMASVLPEMTMDRPDSPDVTMDRPGEALKVQGITRKSPRPVPPDATMVHHGSLGKKVPLHREASVEAVIEGAEEETPHLEHLGTLAVTMQPHLPSHDLTHLATGLLSVPLEAMARLAGTFAATIAAVVTVPLEASHPGRHLETVKREAKAIDRFHEVLAAKVVLRHDSNVIGDLDPHRPPPPRLPTGEPMTWEYR